MSASKVSEVRATWRHARLVERLADQDSAFAAEYRDFVRGKVHKSEAWIIAAALERRKQGRRTA